jgi:hypothetical protein
MMATSHFIQIGPSAMTADTFQFMPDCPQAPSGVAALAAIN